MSKRIQVIALFPDDVLAGVEKFPWLLQEADWICLTIDALSQCLQLKVGHAFIPEWIQAQGYASAPHKKNLQHQLKVLERAVIVKRQGLGFTDECYWNVQHNAMLIDILMSVQHSAQLAVQHLDPQDEYLILQRPDVGDYHHPSGLPAAILNDQFKHHGFNVKLLFLPITQLKVKSSPKAYGFVPDFWSSEMTEVWRKREANVVVSPSGLFYEPDKLKLKSLISSLNAGPHVHVFQPPFWNVFHEAGLFKNTVSVQEAYHRLAQPMQSALMDMVNSTTQALDGVFRMFLDSRTLELDFYQHQLQRLHERHFYQCLVFLGFSHLSAVRPMDAIIVSNLDGAINGPLFSAAQETKTACYVVPHSRVINHPTEAQCTVVTEYWQPKPSQDFKGQLNQVIYYPVERLDHVHSKFSKPRKSKATLLFNGIHRCTNTKTSVNFIRNTLAHLEKIFTQANAQLVHRLKPGDQTPLDAYTHLLDLDRVGCEAVMRQPIDNFLQETELVISLDEPSSAVWQAIEHGCGVLLITSHADFQSGLIDGDVLQTYSDQQAFTLLAQWLHEPALLMDFRRKQYKQLVDRQQQRLP
jgi:hypothetical protein